MGDAVGVLAGVGADLDVVVQDSEDGVLGEDGDGLSGVRAADAQSVAVRDGMELLIMSRMKREVPLNYTGPDGVIYAVYFKINDNMDAGAPLLGVCPKDQLPAIQDVIVRVQTEWTEKE